MTEKHDPVEVLLELMDRAIEDAQPDGLPWPSARAALAALETAGFVIGRIGFPGEIVAGVIEIAQRAQDFNGELVPIRARTTEPGNIEIETDELTIAMDRIDAIRLAALLLREAAMIEAASPTHDKDQTT